jgi:hypothetical protein
MIILNIEKNIVSFSYNSSFILKNIIVNMINMIIEKYINSIICAMEKLII